MKTCREIHKNWGGIPIKMSDGRKEIVFCPACDGCNLIRINDSDRYFAVPDRNRELLDKLLAKYDVIFPCI